MANVFISYRQIDTELAEKLASEVAHTGHQVWFAEWKINVGDSIVERINEGLEGLSYLVLCYSSSDMSPWVNREWMSVLAKQLSGHGVKVLPVLLTGGQPPAILADIKYADLIKDRSKGISDLLRAIK
ncbi:MAG: toll/interleukin-1 receptor domain-containing protein [Nostoc sp.]|uniref:toll/interleukin-1 receptor domain-containing protein n=1 Tax=Nostoc sp. TaxID=1180 RepID=UPI002FF9220E